MRIYRRILTRMIVFYPTETARSADDHGVFPSERKVVRTRQRANFRESASAGKRILAAARHRVVSNRWWGAGRSVAASVTSVIIVATTMQRRAAGGLGFFRINFFEKRLQIHTCFMSYYERERGLRPPRSESRGVTAILRLGLPLSGKILRNFLRTRHRDLIIWVRRENRKFVLNCRTRDDRIVLL